jgi:hypothetical protein
MYDTIDMWLDQLGAGKINFLAQIPYFLTNITEYHSEKNSCVSGYLNNYKVNVYENGLLLKGSLAKYYLNDNIHTLTRGDSQRAIEKLTDTLHVPLINARIYRVDVAKHFQMKSPVYFYYDLLGDKRYFKRLQAAKQTLYYNNPTKQLIFYDKLAESKAKRVNVPEVYRNSNLLRYELRFTSRLSKQFNLPELRASTLINEKFYIEIINHWVNEYLSIDKIKKITLKNNIMYTPDSFFNQLLLMKINEMGQNEVLNLIEELRFKKAFKKPEYYSRAKRKIKDLCNMPDLTEKSDLIAELDQNIKQVKQYYR